MKEINREELFAKFKYPRLRIERAIITTQAQKRHIKDPMLIRRAKVFRAVTNEIPIYIEDWQLIVGNYSSEAFSVYPNPDACWRSIISEIDTFATREGDKYHITDEDKQTLREELPWWDGQSIQDVSDAMMPQEVKDATAAGVLSSGYSTTGSGNFPPNYPKIIQRGLIDIKEDVQRRLDCLDLTIPANLDKREYYESVLICCDGAMEFAARYAKLAKEMAEKETDAVRKAELEKISATCARSLAYPAENIYEAMQTFWFIHVLVHFEMMGTSGIASGRIDQYFYPFFNETERPEIKRYVNNLWYNYNQIMAFLASSTAKVWAGHPMSQQPTLGGIKPDGSDASNELTIMMLETEKELGLPQPDVALMYHDNINPEVMEKACDSMLVTMKPKIFGYEAVKKQAIARGTDPADLVDLVDIGCIASGTLGKFWGNNGFGFFNYGKVLELALNDGFDKRTGKQIGPKTGDAKNFKTFDEVYAAFEAQVVALNKLSITMMNVLEKAQEMLNPQPFCSILLEDCIERGLPPWKGGAVYNSPGMELVAIGSVADAFAAMKKLVFEEKLVSMDELLAALDADFTGDYADLQQMLKNKAPKYGNDEDYVDEIAVKICKLFCDEHSKYDNPRGTKYCPSITSVSAHVGLGATVGALPDGRNAWKPLSDGMSPTQGVCKNGPTAIIQSVAKVDQTITTNGNLLNMKFTSDTLKNPETRQKFIALLRTYFSKLDGFHMQFNIIDKELLLDAQANPEKYPELVVRVAAYVAKFGQLPVELQNDIIARSGMEF